MKSHGLDLNKMATATSHGAQILRAREQMFGSNWGTEDFTAEAANIAAETCPPEDRVLHSHSVLTGAIIASYMSYMAIEQMRDNGDIVGTREQE